MFYILKKCLFVAIDLNDGTAKDKLGKFNPDFSTSRKLPLSLLPQEGNRVWVCRIQEARLKYGEPELAGPETTEETHPLHKRPTYAPKALIH